MTTDKPTSSMQERIADLKETLKKEKVKLTPELEQYIQEHVRAVHDKLQNGEDVYQEDLAFIDEVKLWVGMPEKWRKKYVSIEEMQGSEEQAEAAKRHISFKQWLDVLHVAKAKFESKEWIDTIFTFPGGGKIVVGRDLYLSDCTGLSSLPEGLKVGGSLDLCNCKGLSSLPEGLSVRMVLDLRGCTGLKSLPAEFTVGRNLLLNGCTGLKSLPAEFSVGKKLDLEGCTSLSSLPDGLTVGGDLLLSEDLHEQVRKDARELMAKGKIGGELKYE